MKGSVWLRKISPDSNTLIRLALFKQIYKLPFHLFPSIFNPEASIWADYHSTSTRLTLHTFMCSCLAISCWREVGGRPGRPWPANERRPAADDGGMPGRPASDGGRPGAPGGAPGSPPGPPAACCKKINYNSYFTSRFRVNTYINLRIRSHITFVNMPNFAKPFTCI